MRKGSQSEPFSVGAHGLEPRTLPIVNRDSLNRPSY